MSWNNYHVKSGIVNELLVIPPDPFKYTQIIEELSKV
jgi:hypothetical protein